MSNTYRVTFCEVGDSDDSETVVVKFARSDPATRDLGLKFGHYQREAIFYRRFGDSLSAGLPRCHGAIVDKDAWFTLVLEDLGVLDGYQGAQLEGCDYKHAALALKTLAHLQAPVLGDHTMDNDAWLNPPVALSQTFFNECLPTFRKRQTLEPEQERLLDWMSENLDAWWATREPPFCIFHGDYRLDNIMYLAKDNNRAIAVDWGGLSWASPMRDAAYFLGNGLTIENRRKWEKDLLHEYLNELNGNSKVTMSWDHAWKEYRLQSIYGLAQHIPAAAICAPTERGEIMFHTLASRQAQHALDMDAISLVTSTVTSHSPDVADESQHVTPDEAGLLWNESWYFDCTSADGEAGMYARLGRLPNQGICIFVGGIFRRNKEPVMFVDMHAPLPVTDPWVQQFSTSRFKIESRCLEPLKRFSLQLSGTGSGTSHPSSLLPENYGIDVTNVHVELVWNTSGLPYMKIGQTRYEVACSVTGTITVPGNRFDLNSAPGQRNHSWGIRNWWVADWVWSGLHFPDGTDVFTIGLGKGPQSTGGSGYIQKDKKLTEITGVVNEFEWKENGMPGNLQLHVKPGAITIELEGISNKGKFTRLCSYPTDTLRCLFQSYL